LFTSSIWLGTPVPTGGNDCRDNNPNVNPGSLEIANGIDDDCDGTIDLGLDNDGDGYKTGNVIGISDCHDSVVTDPENQYFGIDPVTVNPGALEIFGDGFDNNCNDFIDEAIIFASDDLYNVDVDSTLSISSPGVLENDTSSGIDPLFTIQQSSPIGILDFNSDGSFTYTPQTLLFSSDSFSYVASDGISESNIVTVTLTQKFCGKDKDEFDNVVVGTTLHDHLLGTNGNDLILGLDGNDKINGLKGNDCIYGGNGNDKINGNNGIDEIHGGNGSDLITGNNDNDKLFGDNGKDKIQGNNGNDFIDGGENSDYCKGGSGSNTIINCEKDDDHDDSDDDNIWHSAKGRFNHK
jgi:Ca2+-binding RTX toxin-like protein